MDRIDRVGQLILAVIEYAIALFEIKPAIANCIDAEDREELNG